MKTGILTFHSAFNFGASLQAWALQTTLEKLGVQPYMINYRPPVIDDLYNPLAKKTGLEKSPFWYGLKHPDQMLRVRKYNRFIHEKFHLLGEARTYEELKNSGFELDACIVGSDQVWNVQHTGGDPSYFLGFLGDEVKKISYAASIGTEYILPVYHEYYREGLKNIRHISVREESARTVLKELTDQEIQVVLDPTLLLDVQEYEAIKTPVHYDEKYILVYMMEKSQDVIRLANSVSRLVGLPVVQRRYYRIFRNEIKPCYTFDPGEFLSCVENAEMVITNSFHGTVFSVLYGKPFISMLHSDTGSRTVNLLETLGLEEHLLFEPSAEECMKKMKPCDKKRTGELILKNREKSLAFLKKSLGV